MQSALHAFQHCGRIRLHWPPDLRNTPRTHTLYQQASLHCKFSWNEGPAHTQMCLSYMVLTVLSLSFAGQFVATVGMGALRYQQSYQAVQ